LIEKIRLFRRKISPTNMDFRPKHAVKHAPTTPMMHCTVQGRSIVYMHEMTSIFEFTWHVEDCDALHRAGKKRRCHAKKYITVEFTWHRRPFSSHFNFEVVADGVTCSRPPPSQQSSNPSSKTFLQIHILLHSLPLLHSW